MKKIKEILIHWLGGYTAEEFEQESQESYEVGYLSNNSDVKKYADSLYGLPSEEWCKQMYEYLRRYDEEL